MDTHTIWPQVLDQLKQTLSYSTFRVFFKNTAISSVVDREEGVEITITAPNAFAAQSLEARFAQTIKEALVPLFPKPVQLLFAAETKPVVSDTSSTPLFNPQTSEYLEEQTQKNVIKSVIVRANLKEDCTFENFAVSPTNEVAYAGAMAVAKNPGHAYNPLFLYGDVGVGKTHLMQAVGIRIMQTKPNVSLVYCAGEQFTNEIIDAIRTKKTPEFRARYRKAEVLLIDDIQFIAGKNTVQEEFFHTFNAIQGAGGQVILTSDRPPHEIKLLEDRLRSRFEEGLTIDIQNPNFELRTAILLIKAKQMNQALPMDVAQVIANHITSTRKLQGFLSKLFTISALRNKPVSTTLAFNLLGEQQPDEPIQAQRRYVSPKAVIATIAKYFNVSPTALSSANRSKPIVTPRQYAMYLLKNDLDISLVEIGRIFGGRDHTTVMHAVEKVSLEVSTSEELQREFSTIRKQIYG